MVWLNNGDRLTGEIILLDGGKLALKARYAGQVLIAWKDIDTLRSEKPLLVRREGSTVNTANSWRRPVKAWCGWSTPVRKPFLWPASIG
jgi:hypothetical protein